MSTSITELDIRSFALLAMGATVRNFSGIKNVPLTPERAHQVAEAAMDTLSIEDVYGLAKAHRTSVLAAGAGVNRCLDIIAATRMAFADANRENENPDFDAIAARVIKTPEDFIPAEARQDIYRWPDIDQEVRGVS